MFWLMDSRTELLVGCGAKGTGALIWGLELVGLGISLIFRLKT